MTVKELPSDKEVKSNKEAILLHTLVETGAENAPLPKGSSELNGSGVESLGLLTANNISRLMIKSNES